MNASAERLHMPSTKMRQHRTEDNPKKQISAVSGIPGFKTTWHPCYLRIDLNRWVRMISINRVLYLIAVKVGIATDGTILANARKSQITVK